MGSPNDHFKRTSDLTPVVGERRPKKDLSGLVNQILFKVGTGELVPPVNAHSADFHRPDVTEASIKSLQLPYGLTSGVSRLESGLLTRTPVDNTGSFRVSLSKSSYHEKKKKN